MVIHFINMLYKYKTITIKCEIMKLYRAIYMCLYTNIYDVKWVTNN